MSGRKANEAGESHLNIVHEILSRDGGFAAPRFRGSGPAVLNEMADFIAANLFGERRVMARGIGLCLHQFGDPFVADFIVHSAGWPGPVALLCYSQTSAGSTYWKVPAWIEVVRDYFPDGCRAAAVLAGGAYPPGLPIYLSQCIGRTRGRFCRVFDSIDDLRNWARDGAVFPANEQARLPL